MLLTLYVPGLRMGAAGISVTVRRFVDEDFRTFLLTLVPAGVPVEKGKISTEQPPVRVYFQRQSTTRDRLLGGQAIGGSSGGLYETWFVVEVGSLDDDATCQTLAELLKEGRDTDSGIDGFNGLWGSSPGHFIQAAFVSEHEDDYEPRILDADEGYYVASFRVQVLHEAA